MYVCVYDSEGEEAEQNVERRTYLLPSVLRLLLATSKRQFGQ